MDHSFPRLDWPPALLLARMLGFEGIDLALITNRSHLSPESLLAAPARTAAVVSAQIRDAGLTLSDIFCYFGTSFASDAINHPAADIRRATTDTFRRLLEFAVAAGARHITILPGVVFPEEGLDTSLRRAAEELAWRAQAAAAAGILLGVEPHSGSIAEDWRAALRLQALCPALTWTLDLAHYTYQGVRYSQIAPMVPRTSHVHARAAMLGSLQVPLEQNEVEFTELLAGLQQSDYAGSICLEYVCTDSGRYGVVDVLSETILLSRLLQEIWPAALSAASI
jgi:sugar phosphate isomerase/epimerase